MKNQGFTVIELMLVVAIVAISLSIGVPSFLNSVQNNRMTGQINSLIGALSYARSEAVKLGQNNVTICASNDNASCSGSSAWEDGWIIFQDNNNDGSVDSGETLLRISEELSGDNTLRSTGFASDTLLSFNNRGMVSSSGSFQLCDDRGASDAKAVILNISGQSRLATDDDGSESVNIHSGGDISCP